MSKLTSLLALTLVCLSHLCPAEELTLDVLIRGVNQARLTIQSGEVRTIVTVKRAAQKTEKEIVEWKQTEIENELRNFRPHSLFPDVGFKEFKKDFLEPVSEFEADRYRQRIENENSTTIFRLLMPDTDHFLYQYKLTGQEVKGLSLDSENAQHVQDSNFSLLAHDGKKQVKHNIGNAVFVTAPRDTVQFFGADSEHGGFWDFDIFGRSSIPIGTDTQLIGKEQIDGAECYILASTDTSGWHGQIWVDPNTDFCIRKEEVRLGSDTLINQVFYKDFEQFGDIWFPKVREGIHYRKNGTVKTETRVEIIEAQFNVKFPEDFFHIDRDFYYQPGPRRPPELPDSGHAPVTPKTDAEELFLLCGPQSLLRICEILKIETSIGELIKLTGFNPDRGTTMLGLKQAATFKNIGPIGVKASVSLLRKEKVPLPAIAYVEGNHFLVFEAVNKSGVEILDPAQKYDPHLTWNQISEIWSGDLLIFDPNEARKRKAKQPLAFVETSEYDFGKALGGSQIKHTFTIKNVGQKPLKIFSVKETCTCTATVVSQDEIPANGIGSISAVLTVPSGNETVEESLLVLTNDPTQGVLTLTLKGQAFVPLTTFPERLAIGNQKPLQKQLTKRVSLHLADEVQVLGVRTDSEHLKATLEKGTDEAFFYVNVQLLPTQPVGKFSHNLLIHYTYHGQQTTHNVIAFGQVLGELYVAPNRLFFGMIKEPSVVSKKITISTHDGQPFQITSAKSSAKGVVANVAKDESGTRYEITISIAPTAKPGELSGDIVVKTSSSVQPTLRVPFFGILAGSD